MGVTSSEKTTHNVVISGEKNSELAPLLSPVRTVTRRQRHPRDVLRCLCAIALSCGAIVWFTIFLFDFGSPGPRQRNGHLGWEFSWPSCRERTLSYEELKQILLDTPSSEKAEEWQRYYTAGAHLAGQNYSQVRSLAGTLGFCQFAF